MKKRLDPCPNCGWYRDESGQCHEVDCEWVDGDFDRLRERMPEEDWDEEKDQLKR